MPSERKVRSFADQKRELIAQSAAYRQSMQQQCGEVQRSLAWVPKAAQTARSFAPLLALAVPVAGLLLFRRGKTNARSFALAPKQQPKPAKKGLLAMAITAFSLYNRVRPVIDAFTHAKAQGAAAAKRSEQRARV